MIDQLLEIKDKVEDAENIFLASHIQPDGDNLGSLLGLAKALSNIGKDVYILKSDEIPEDFKFLPGIEDIKEYDGQNIDLFISLDCADENRLGENTRHMKNANFVINIDHHMTNTKYGDINIVDSKAAATGELVYLVIDFLGIDLDEDIATNLYTAISTDTGSFIYENTSSQTHAITSKLIDAGARTQDVSINIYQSNSLDKTRLFIEVIKDIELIYNNRVSIATVSQEKLKATNTSMDDTEGIVSFIRDIETVELAILFKEIEKDEIKLSMRSKKEVNVSDLCAKFDGGGHKRAAGCTIYKDLNTAKKLVLKEIEKVLGH